jgi:enoyl-CoA hydratase
MISGSRNIIIPPRVKTMKKTSTDVVLYEESDRIAYITINRPESLNAMNLEVRTRIAQICQHITVNPDVRLAIITGQGKKAFSAGGDLDDLNESLKTRQSAQEGATKGQLLFNLIENLRKPVIAAVNGYALGAGCELILACTLRIASTSAKFGLPEIKVGTLPGHGGIPRLVRLVGRDRAAELVLTGEMIDANEAYRIGLVTHLVSPDELMATCEKVAHRIITHPQLSVSLGLEAINYMSEMTIANALPLESALAALASSSQASQARIKQMIENRKIAQKKSKSGS